MKQKETIEMQRAWLESLLKIAERFEHSEGAQKSLAEATLIGFISSAKFIIEHL
jgi:hypothetical protein